MLTNSIRVVVLLAALIISAQAETVKDIAYLRLTDHYWQVWLTNSTGRLHKQLTFDEVDYTRVHWPLDHSFLLASRADGKVVKIQPETTDAKHIELPFDEVFDASVSPNGQRLAYSYVDKKENKAKVNIWVSNLDGSNHEQLTQLEDAQVLPVWSANGNKLAFTHLGSSKGKQYEIWEIDMPSNNHQQHTTGDGYHFDPAYGPNGELAYTSNSSGAYDIWVQLPDLSRKNISQSPYTEDSPSWSPDGKQLAYASLEGGQQRIWVMDVRGDNKFAITPVEFPSRGPAWFN